MQASVRTVAEILNDPDEYVIPQFQRAYRWGRENHWEPLWDDIKNVVNRMVATETPDTVAPHFLARLYAKSEKCNGCPYSGVARRAAGARRFLTVGRYWTLYKN